MEMEEEGGRGGINNITRWEQEDAMRGNVDLFGGPTDVVDHAAGGRQRKDRLDTIRHQLSHQHDES